MKEIYYVINSVNWGDTLMSTPTLRLLFNAHQQKINIVTHKKDVFNNNPYVNIVLSFEEFGSINASNIIIYNSFTFPGSKDNNGIEKKFSRIDTRQLHAFDLGFQLLPEELHCDFYPNPMSLDLDLPKDYVVLHVTTNWPNRTWGYNKWSDLIKWLKDNKIFTVLIGAGYREELHNSYSDKPLDKNCPLFDDYYGLDLTNKGTMSDMWWIINGAKAIVTMDSGPLHLAGTTDVEIIQLGSAINPKLRAPYRYGSQEYKYHHIGGSCNIYCNSNLEYNVRVWGDINSVPPQPNCLENKPTFECHPQVPEVIAKIKEIINLPETNELVIQKKLKFGLYTSFYNCEKFIEQSFKNIEGIDYDNFEWHITDDYSSDNTKKVLLNRLSVSPIKNKIKYMEQSEKKQMYWRPDLFFDETFDWIVVVDSDDLIDKNFLNIYKNLIKNKDDVTLISSDFHKIYEDNDNLHSISYILNDSSMSNKIEKYHPYCDYLNNISYSSFGTLRAFKNNIKYDFIINDKTACADDSYRVFWVNSFGKYLHVPRPLYTWIYRTNSESHTKNPPSNFNANFNLGLDKLKSSDFGVDMTFNDVYLETCSLGSFKIGELNGKDVSLWTREMSDVQKENLKKLYFDVKLTFNNINSDIHIFSVNYFDLNNLDLCLQKIKGKKMLFYYQNQKVHNTNEEKDNELNIQLDNYISIISKYTGCSWWKYIRHFIISN